jgi:hypothetical protein
MNMDDDDIPWADPAIRTAYEAALGRFILAFNEVDFRLSQIIRAELTKSGQTGLAESVSKGPFVHRLETLDILIACSTGIDGIKAISVAKLRSLNTDRNNLAHGHFDQNPYDGSYKLVLSAKTRAYPIARIAKLADELTAIAESMLTVEVIYGFSDLTKKDPPPVS